MPKRKKKTPPAAPVECIGLSLEAGTAWARAFTEHGPPRDHRGCCDCALCGVASLSACEPVAVAVFIDGACVRGTNVCPSCAALLRPHALDEAELRILEGGL